MVLIHSPFLGPATWRSTARVLEGAGRRALVPDLSAVAHSAPPYWPAGLESIVRTAADDPVVPHSNAGLFVPAVIEARGDPHVPGGHLHMLVGPRTVGTAVLTMVGAWR